MIVIFHAISQLESLPDQLAREETIEINPLSTILRPRSAAEGLFHTSSDQCSLKLYEMFACHVSCGLTFAFSRRRRRSATTRCYAPDVSAYFYLRAGTDGFRRLPQPSRRSTISRIRIASLGSLITSPWQGTSLVGGSEARVARTYSSKGFFLPPTSFIASVLMFSPGPLPVRRNSSAKMGFFGRLDKFVMHSFVNQVTASSRVMTTIASGCFMPGISVMFTSLGSKEARASKFCSGLSVLCTLAMCSIALFGP